MSWPDCQEWPLGRSGVGYGTCKGKGPKTRMGAHVAVWEYFHGPVPAGWYVMHKCDNRPCVNPDHLFAGPPKANTQDMIQKGRARMPAAFNRFKTHCKRGHPFDEVNTYRTRKGGRCCRACMRDYLARYYREVTCANRAS